jgi:glycine cleavage system H lipoate-binding protein
MADATGTLAGLNELLSDTPTDINAIQLRVTLIAAAISTIASELDDKLKQTPGLIPDEQLEQQAIAQIEPLNRELERLLEVKRQLETQER